MVKKKRKKSVKAKTAVGSPVAMSKPTHQEKLRSALYEATSDYFGDPKILDALLKVPGAKKELARIVKEREIQLKEREKDIARDKKKLGRLKK